MKYIIIILLFFTSFSLFAQKYTISGYIRDANSGEDLIGANLFVKEILKGAITNKYGFYSLTLPAKKYSLRVSYIGYQNDTIEIALDKNITLNIDLQVTAITTKEVIVYGEGLDKNVRAAEMGTVNLAVKQVKLIPALLGEVDLMKTLQLLPGVQSASEGSSGFYVRGGGPDQNLILLDEAPVYNASHLFGFFSVFNADAVKDINLIKGGMPANYGGRLSSVLDITMKEGNMKRLEADGGIGIISSRLTLQGPIIKDTCSFLVSARRTYFDVLAKPFIPEDSEFNGSGYYFFDLNAKVSYRFSDKDRLFFSSYYGKDVFTYVDSKSGFALNIPWGNTTGTLRWNHVFNNKLFMNITAIYTKYYFEFDATQDNFDFKLYSGIEDLMLKASFTYIMNPKNTLKYGADYINHTFTPSSVSARIGETHIDADKIHDLYAHDAAFYVNDEFDLGSRWRFNVGLRATLFQHIGPFDRFVKNENNFTTDTISYADGEEVKMYFNIEPRFTARFEITPVNSLKFAYTQNYQYIHLAAISSASMPTDLWIPSTDLVEPQYGVQYATGYFHNFMDNMFEASVELYYKELDNLIEYADGAAPSDNMNDNADNNFTFGSGVSYGAEFFIRKNSGSLTGWVGYTWAKTERDFEGLNSGNTFYAKYDRRHDLSLILSYQLNDRWTFSSVFVYSTGNAITLPVARYWLEGRIYSEYSERNAMRMAAYHRVDISATYKRKRKGRYQSSWNFSIYNVYNRYNPFFIFYETTGQLEAGSLQTKAKQVSLFPIIPSITWNFSF